MHRADNLAAQPPSSAAIPAWTVFWRRLMVRHAPHQPNTRHFKRLSDHRVAWYRPDVHRACPHQHPLGLSGCDVRLADALGVVSKPRVGDSAGTHAPDWGICQGTAWFSTSLCSSCKAHRWLSLNRKFQRPLFGQAVMTGTKVDVDL